MTYDINLLVFDRFRHVERMLRTGRVETKTPFPQDRPGRVKKADDSCSGGFPRREILLLFLMMHKEGMRQREFADEIRVSPSTVSEMVMRLVQDGYVEQKSDAGDRRVKTLTLTGPGEERARILLSEFTGQLASMFGNLDQADKRELIRLLDKMLGMEHASPDLALGMSRRGNEATG